MVLPYTFKWIKGSSDFQHVGSGICLSEIILSFLQYQQCSPTYCIVGFFELQNHFALLTTLAPTVLEASVLAALGQAVLGVATALMLCVMTKLSG